ncbi:MAG TPA: hypothetical protein VKP30_07960 [Polyangiaceae bacterium]|nr:hypothetical protein [Polyangiaceae bacterium]
MNNALRNSIAEALMRDASVSELATILRKHRDEGLSQQTAYELLEALRKSVDEQREERLLEVMDIVSGFCKADDRIWGERAQEHPGSDFSKE